MHFMHTMAQWGDAVNEAECRVSLGLERSRPKRGPKAEMLPLW